MAIVLDGTTGITTPGLTNTGTETIVNLTTTGNTILGDASTDTLNVGNGGLVKDASGNVGIGTASPNASYKMSITGNSASIYSGILFTDTNAGGGVFSIYGESAALKFRDSSAGATRMVIDSSGNVGIGTSSPAAKLHVDSTTSGQMARFNSTAANGGYITGYSSGTGVWDLGTAIQAFATGSSTDVGLTSRSGFLGFGTASIERMRIDTSGNVLVGTTSATGKITVQTSGNTYGVFSENTNTITTSNYYFWGYGSGSTRFIAYGNGGIANYSANNVNLSDRREKTNFAPAGDYLTKICAIPVQTFNYIDQNLEEDGGLTLGIVAQDVQAVAPELITESNWGTEEEPKMRLSIYQTDLQYALMKCIQELKALVDTQASTITQLQADVAALKAQP